MTVTWMQTVLTPMVALTALVEMGLMEMERLALVIGNRLCLWLETFWYLCLNTYVGSFSLLRPQRVVLNTYSCTLYKYYKPFLNNC